MKNVLILGGTGGIGKEIIKNLAAQKCFIINIDKEKSDFEIENFIEINVDLLNTDIQKLIGYILEKVSRIDVFICSLGFYGVKTLETFSIEEYTKTQKINVEIPTLFVAELLRYNSRDNETKLIFISSAAAYIGSRDLAYSISKAGMLGLIRGLCKNLEGSNIYTYGIAPGIVETPMSEQMNSSRQNDTISRTLNKRKCSTQEISGVVLFLIFGEVNYMNGGIIHINNGLYLN